MGVASGSESQRCKLFGNAPYFAEVAWLWQMRSLPCHMGCSNPLGLVGFEPVTLSKRGPLVSTPESTRV